MEAARKVETADNLGTAVAMAISACGGDLRDTIAALVVANSFLVDEVEQLKGFVSLGLVRGRLSVDDMS